MQILGPHFGYDLVRLARQGRTSLLRVLYLLVLLAGMLWAYPDRVTGPRSRLNDQALAAERFFVTLVMLQNMAILVLGPIYFAGAIAEERERKTLDLLFTTALRNREIFFGKLFGRALHVGAILLSGLPVVSIALVFGGVDMALLLANFVNSALLLVTVASVCLVVSTQSGTVTTAVAASYVLMVIPAACLVPEAGGAFLIAGREREFLWNGVLARALVHGAICATCWALGLAALGEFRGSTQGPARIKQDKATGKVLPTMGPPGPLEQKPPPHYVLPPIGDNALLWKERYQGGPSGGMYWLLVLGFPWLLLVVLPLLLGNWAISIKPVVLLLVLGSLGLCCVGVALRGAASVARERQDGTLDMLLTLPVERRRILAAKWQGNLARGLSWAVLFTIGAALGGVTGTLDPGRLVLLVVFATAHLMFFNSLALFLSVTSLSVLAARLKIMGVLLILFGVCPFCLGDVRWDRDGTGFLAALSPPVSWWLAAFDDQSASFMAYFRMGPLLHLIYLIGAYLLWILAVEVFEELDKHGAGR